MSRLDFIPTKELIEAYRTVFSSKRADEVLGHMFWELGLFNDNTDMTAEEFALRSYANHLIMILSGSRVSQDTLNEFIKKLIDQPIPEEKEED